MIKVLTNSDNKLTKDLERAIQIYNYFLSLSTPLCEVYLTEYVYFDKYLGSRKFIKCKIFSDNIQLASALSIFLLNRSDCLLAASYPCLTSCGSSGNAQGLDLNFTSTSLFLTTSCLNFGFLAAPSHTF